MRTYTTTVREGERTGDIDWGYDFRKHFDNYGTSDSGKDDLCARSTQRLREIAELHAKGARVRATTYGGWPRIGFCDVLDVGMYDGWPYWAPVPSVLMRDVLGGASWHSFCSLTDYEIADATRGN